MKVKLSFWHSEHENHTSEWDVPWCDWWPIRLALDEHFELLDLRRENAELKRATPPTPPKEGTKK